MPREPFVQIHRNPHSHSNENLSSLEEEHEELGPGPHLIFAFNSYSSLYTPQSKITLAITLVIVITLMGMFLRDNKWMKPWSRFVPSAAIFCSLGFILGVLSDQIVPGDAAASVQLPANVISSILISPVILHYSYNLCKPKFLRRFGKICFFSVANYANTTALTSLILSLWIDNSQLQQSGPPTLMVLHCTAFASLLALPDPLVLIADFRKTIGSHDVVLTGEALLTFSFATNLFHKLVLAMEQTEIREEEVLPADYVFLSLSVATDILGGALLGILWGLLTAVTTMLMDDAAYYFEASICLLCSVLAVESARNLGLSTTAALLAIGLTQQRYAFINMSIISASALRNLVHSVSTLLEIILLVLLGNDLSNITRGNGPDQAVILGLVGFAAVLLARFISCLITSFVITSRHNTLGTIDARWLAIVVLGGLRGPGTYVLCLAYAFSPSVDGVENFNVKLFKEAISIVIVMTLLLQGTMTKVLTRPFREEGHDTTARRFLFLAARFAGEGLDEATGESLSSHPIYLCRTIIDFEHRLYSFFYGAQKQYFSAHDLMATQLRQEEFYKLLAKHNMLPPPGWVKSKLKGREHANSVTLV